MKQETQPQQAPEQGQKHPQQKDPPLWRNQQTPSYSSPLQNTPTSQYNRRPQTDYTHTQRRPNNSAKQETTRKTPESNKSKDPIPRISHHMNRLVKQINRLIH